MTNEMKVPVLSIERFNPKVEELKTMAEQARAIVVTDPTDKAQIELVAEARKGLKKARVEITKVGKALRDETNAFNKKVIAYEDSLIALIEPEEKRLAEIEAAIELAAEIEAMKLLLPSRRARIATLEGVEVDDSTLNAMSIPQFEQHFVQWQQIVNDNKARALEAERAKVQAEANRQAEEQARKDAEEKARADERAKIAREQADADAERERKAQAERDRVAQQAKEAAEKVERDAREKAAQIEREAREKADAEERARQAETARKEKEAADAAQKVIQEAQEKAAIEKAERFTKFLKDNGVTKENATQHEQRHVGNTVQLWRKVATYITE